MDDIKKITAEALMKAYPESTIRLIKDAVENGSTPDQIERITQKAVEGMGKNNSRFPNDAAVIAEYFIEQKKGNRVSTTQSSEQQGITVSPERIRGLRF